MATICITHIATSSQSVTAAVVRTDGVLVSEHILRPGETHNVAIRDGQRLLVIQATPPLATRAIEAG